MLLCGALVLAAKVFIATGAGQSFIHGPPCVPNTPRVKPGVPAWVIVTHLANFFFMVMIVRAGWQILADHPRLYTKVHCTPDREVLRFRGPVPKDRVWTAKDDAITLSPLFGMPGGRHTIGVARHWHFIFDILFVLNGIVYVAFCCSPPPLPRARARPTRRSCPARRPASSPTLRCIFPREPGGFFRYDALQQLSYFGVIFLLGAAGDPHRPGDVPRARQPLPLYQRLFGNRQIARSIHFLVMVAFVVFYVVPHDDGRLDRLRAATSTRSPSAPIANNLNGCRVCSCS